VNPAARARLAEMSLKGRLPTMYCYREDVEAGGLTASRLTRCTAVAAELLL